MEVFFDNDTIQKLATADLLEDALAILSATQADVRVLGSARFKFDLKHPERGRKKFGAAVYDRIQCFLAASQTVVIAVEADYELLSKVTGIDAGEAILYASAANADSSLLVTGDKTSIRALGGDADCSSIARRLKGRVICLEQLIDRIIRTRGFRYLLQKIVDGKSAGDGALRVAFAQGLQSTESEVKAALDSFVRDLRREDGGVLAP